MPWSTHTVVNAIVQRYRLLVDLGARKTIQRQDGLPSRFQLHSLSRHCSLSCLREH